MKQRLASVWLTAIAALLCGADAQAQQRAQYEALVATHAQANGVPEALVHRVIVRESRYQPALVGRGGTIGLMQIKLATARGLGYTGTAEGLRDPETNLIYGIKYLAGAYRAAGSDHSRAMHYYASGYYYAAKRQRHEHATPGRFQPNSRHRRAEAMPSFGRLWPGKAVRATAVAYAQPSTFFLFGDTKGVDARHKAGHDERVSVDTPAHRPTLALFRGEL
jgi:soluble lytic murein transglycosylase-like protein